MDDRTEQPEMLDERFRRALDSILDLVVIERAIRDERGEIVDFRIEWMNNAPVDVAQRPREELIGRRISELYPSLAGGELIAGYRAVVETGEPMVVDVLPYEDVIDGETVSGYYTVQATKFEDGVLVASRDITALEASRRELEVALHDLKQTFEELEAAQRLAQLGTWRIDLSSGRMQISRELQRMYGFAPRSERDHDLNVLSRQIHPEDRRLARDAYERAISTREAVSVEHRVLNADGSVGHVRSYTQPVVEDGRVVELWGTTQDITERVESRDAFDAEHSRRVNAEALATLSADLSSAATRQEVADSVHAVVHATGPVSTVAVSVLEDDGQTLHQCFGGDVANEIQARYRRIPVAADTPVGRAVTTGGIMFLPDRETVQREFPLLAADFDATSTQALAVLPLRRANGALMGVVGIGWRDARHFDAVLVAMLSDAADAVARTLERLEVLELERSVARTLQQGLLALDVRTTAAVVRARYRAAETALEIGGDWYDAVDLGRGRLAVAVGDVVGRGIEAATTMGQLRAALGVTSLQASDAGDAVTILDRYAQHVPGAMCTTVAFAMLDTAAETVSYLSAGHPPPLLVTPTGDVRFLEDGSSWPLGLAAPRPRGPAATAALPGGSLLLLYTDGLVERRGESVEQGLARLADVVQRSWYLPLRRLKQAIFKQLVDDRADDDIALVAVRSVGASPDLFVDAFRARPSELASFRQRFRNWFETHSLGGQLLDDVQLALGEAAANAIDHGSEDEDQVVRVEAARTSDGLVISVSDSGHWQSGIEGFFTGRGRGHLLMRALAEDVEIDSDQHGSIVTLHFSRQPEYA